MPKLIGFGAAGLNTQQLAYRSSDKHLYEMNAQPDWCWSSAFDLSAIVPAPDVFFEGYLAGCALNKSKHYFYLGNDRHIYQLSAVMGAPNWVLTDLTATATVAPKALWPKGVTPPTDVPLADALEVAFAYETMKSLHVIFWTNDGHLHELRGINNKWTYIDLTAVATYNPNQPKKPILKGPPPLVPHTSLVTGFALDPFGIQIYYQTSAGHVQEIYQFPNTTAWSTADLTHRTTKNGVPEIKAQTMDCGFASKFHNTKQVYFRDQDGDIYELFAPGSRAWTCSNITEKAKAPRADGGVVVGCASGSFKSLLLYYRTSDGRLHELSTTDRKLWSHLEITTRSGTNTPFAGPDYMAFAYDSTRSKTVVFLTDDHHVNKLTAVLNGPWEHADLSNYTGAPLPG